jgi:hypothetical protein
MDEPEYQKQLSAMESKLKKLENELQQSEKRIGFMELLLYQLYQTFPSETFSVKKIIATLIKGAKMFEFKVQAEAAEVYKITTINKKTHKKTTQTIDHKQVAMDKLEQLENTPEEEVADEFWREKEYSLFQLFVKK